jgi:hypothetical protein
MTFVLTLLCTDVIVSAGWGYRPEFQDIPILGGTDSAPFFTYYPGMKVAHNDHNDTSFSPPGGKSPGYPLV